MDHCLAYFVTPTSYSEQQVGNKYKWAPAATFKGMQMPTLSIIDMAKQTVVSNVVLVVIPFSLLSRFRCYS
jgi:hypothetical protein